MSIHAILKYRWHGYEQIPLMLPPSGRPIMEHILVGRHRADDECTGRRYRDCAGQAPSGKVKGRASRVAPGRSSVSSVVIRAICVSGHQITSGLKATA